MNDEYWYTLYFETEYDFIIILPRPIPGNVRQLQHLWIYIPGRVHCSLVHTHWLSSYNPALSLVESFPSDACASSLVPSRTSSGIQNPLLEALEGKIPPLGVTSRGLWMPGSLWHKTVGKATPWNSPRHWGGQPCPGHRQGYDLILTLQEKVKFTRLDKDTENIKQKALADYWNYLPIELQWLSDNKDLTSLAAVPGYIYHGSRLIRGRRWWGSTLWDSLLLLLLHNLYNLTSTCHIYYTVDMLCDVDVSAEISHVI